MYRTTLRSARPVAASLRAGVVRAAPRRFASTATPVDKSRSWKSSAVRLGLAFGAVYYYNTSPVFADEATSRTIPAPAAFSDNDLPTIDSVLEEKRSQIKAKLEKNPETPKPTESKPTESQPTAQTTAVEGSPAALEEEAGQQGAFNPETGEINWDCPCLGGMADGPCGEDFKTAFSCFVFSEEEPKGMDCIDKFQGMQECFKKYPEIYGAELADDGEDGAPVPDFGEEPVAESADVQKSTPEVVTPEAAPKTTPEAITPEAATAPATPAPAKEQITPVEKTAAAKVTEKIEKAEETTRLDTAVLPVEAHDATFANVQKDSK